MRAIFFAALTCLTALVLPPAPSYAASPMKLESVVIFNRHSLRSPIGDPDDADYYKYLSKDRWPGFGVQPGFLTKQGKKAAKQMGAFYGHYFRKNNLYRKGSCPGKSAVLVHADNYQRTVVTAKKMIKGMLPGCSYPVEHLAVGPDGNPKSEVDPLFDPTGADICTENDTKNNSYKDKLIGTTSDIANDYASNLSKLQTVLDCCKPAACQKARISTDNCTLDSFSGEDQVNIATSVSENFVMEYGSGLPMSEVAWGRAKPNVIRKVNALHALLFYGFDANAYAAKINASNVANEIYGQLKSAGTPGGDKITLLVAHDNNVLNLGGLLDSKWTLDSYSPFETPPGSGIAFEVWKDAKNGEKYVSVAIRAQTMKQLRKTTKLKVNGPEPAAVDLTAQFCGGKSDMCPYATFMSNLKKKIYKPCVGD